MAGIIPSPSSILSPLILDPDALRCASGSAPRSEPTALGRAHDEGPLGNNWRARRCFARQLLKGPALSVGLQPC